MKEIEFLALMENYNTVNNPEYVVAVLSEAIALISKQYRLNPNKIDQYMKQLDNKFGGMASEIVKILSEQERRG